MLKYLIPVLLLLMATSAQAQDDSLFAVQKVGTGKFIIRYKAKPRETVKMLAKRFYLSENQVEYANEYNDLRKIKEGTIVYLPMSKENFMLNKPTMDPNVVPLYYHPTPKDEIGLLSSYLGLTKAEFRTRNGLKGNSLKPEDALFLGWVKMHVKDSTDPEYDQMYPVAKKKKTLAQDTVQLPVPGGLDTAYNRQTMNGTSILSEKGTAVFFDKVGKNDVYYAFHNGTPKGTIIRIFNPGTGRVTYARVLGPLPNNKVYVGAIIGISTPAREALDVRDDKAWLEISYSAN